VDRNPVMKRFRFRVIMVVVFSMLFAVSAATFAVAEEQTAPTGQAQELDSIGLTIRQQISQLDADTFQARDEATRAIAAHGATAVPYLVESLDNSSAELRMRVMMLLAENGSFEIVAPYLLKAIDRPGGMFARTVLKDRCLQQIDDAGQIVTCERLLKFWGTTHEKYRHEAVVAFQNAKSTEQISLVIEPLLHIGEKVKQFDDLIARLSKQAVASDHRHSSGYIVAETMALGLRTGRTDWVAFGVKYVESLELLALSLSSQKRSRNEIRQEVANRSSWSQGATAFLVQLLDPESQPSKALGQSIHIAPQSLQESFFDGLRSPDAATYSKGVGRVHIVDLLNDAIRTWPAIPEQGTVAELVGCIVDSAHEGNKPHALVYLEALDACRKLQNHGLDLNHAPAKQLSDRLFVAARVAQNHRDFFPVHSMFNKFVTLFDRGIKYDHQAFPRELFDEYVQNTAPVTEEQRAALDRYISVVERTAKTEKMQNLK
jgi:hypothetical protein